MIELKEITYVRLGTPDLEMAASFRNALPGGRRSRAKALYLRSDDRAHTLFYAEDDPDDQTVGFEVKSETELEVAAATLEALGHPVRAGTPDERTSRMVKAVIGFKDPTGNHIISDFAVCCANPPNGFVRRELQRHSQRRVRS